MKTIFKLFLILTIGFSTYAQNHTSKTSITKTEKPILIINDTIIGGSSLLHNVSSKKISQLNILKDKKLSLTYLFLENEKNPGIIKADINQEFKIKSQKELNEFFALNEKNDIYVNGYLIENKNQNILSESIVEIELLKADHFRLEKPVLNIKIE